VYIESKHGNVFLARSASYDLSAVPWTVGKDFAAPSCATCHNSLLVHPDGTVVAERSHDFGARLWWRIFGLVYSHPQPESGATYSLRNKDGLPLPTAYTGEHAASGLLPPAEIARRRAAMEGVCRSCHGTTWAQGFFADLDTTIAESDRMTREATALLERGWASHRADPANPFDEPLEHQWIAQWLFYATSLRYAAAMSGPDYATFKYGWWDLTANLAKMQQAVAGKGK
jgi:mono/diheme cytochrome c family protein